MITIDPYYLLRWKTLAWCIVNVIWMRSLNAAVRIRLISRRAKLMAWLISIRFLIKTGEGKNEFQPLMMKKLEKKKEIKLFRELDNLSFLLQHVSAWWCRVILLRSTNTTAAAAAEWTCSSHTWFHCLVCRPSIHPSMRPFVRVFCQLVWFKDIMFLRHVRNVLSTLSGDEGTSSYRPTGCGST
jgi:hypothetical protein